VSKPLDLERLTALVRESCSGLPEVEPERILKATLKDLYNGVAMEEVRKCVVLAARTLIEKDPAYSFVTARLLLDSIRFEALGEEASQADMATKYAEYFPRFVKHGIEIGLLNEGLLQYDLKTLGTAMVPERDLQFGYLGLQTLYDRYFLVDQYVGGRGLSCRTFFIAWRWARAERGRARGARNRIYNVLDLRLHEQTPTLFNRHA
jgi:ribonucleoside-diphosphate reductase alpha chain